MTVHQNIGLTPAEIAKVRLPLAQASFLPARVYSDPSIFELERERIFRRSWLPLCHVSMVREPGDYVARNLVGEAVVAVRGRDGELRVLSNVCRHRNSVLTRGSGACKGNKIICPYHGWTYGLDGKLLAAPFMDQAEDFVRRDVGLPEIRSEIFQGFVFVTFDPEALPLSERVGGIASEIGPYRFEDMEAFELRRRLVPWNWKISLENFSEAYHQPWVHPKTADHEFPAALARYLDTPGAYSVFTLHQRDGQDVPTFVPPLSGLSQDFLKRVTVFNIYPYMHGLTDPATPLILDFNINNEYEHELIWTVLMPPGSRGKEAITNDIKAFEDFMSPILAEDVDICTNVSLGVRSQYTEQGRMSHMEKAIHQFHNWWLDKVYNN